MKLPTIALIAVVFLSGCAAQTEVLSWSTGKQNWVVGHYNEIPRQYSIHEFIREGGDIKNWTELVTMQNFTGTWGGASAEEAYNNLKAIREKECPGVTKWNVINKDGSSILYEWQATPCAGWPDQHELTRILFGKYNRFLLRYTTKKYQMEPEARNEWINILSDAHIVSR